jgi:hypothetical protein
VLDARALGVESLTHAFVVKYLKEARDAAVSDSEREKWEGAGFTWLSALLKALKMYDENRAIYGTLDAFMPNITAFFDGIEDKPFMLEKNRAPEDAPKDLPPGNPDEKGDEGEDEGSHLVA